MFSVSDFSCTHRACSMSLCGGAGTGRPVGSKPLDRRRPLFLAHRPVALAHAKGMEVATPMAAGADPPGSGDRPGTTCHIQGTVTLPPRERSARAR